jgi:hypothetical protein
MGHTRREDLVWHLLEDLNRVEYQLHTVIHELFYKTTLVAVIIDVDIEPEDTASAT